MRERRKHTRRDVQVSGLLSFDDGKSFEACRLANVSEGGALIHVRSPKTLPDQVSLYYDDPDGELRVEVAWCHIVRRGEHEVALRFIYASSVPDHRLAA